MWSGVCETTKYGSYTIYQRQNEITTYITIGVVAFIFICGPCVLIWRQRSRPPALGGKIHHDVGIQIKNLDPWETRSKVTHAVSSDATTTGKSIGFTAVSGKAHTKPNYQY